MTTEKARAILQELATLAESGQPLVSKMAARLSLAEGGANRTPVMRQDNTARC